MLVLVGAVFFAAGVVKGLSGMGLPTLSMALLSLAMPANTAAALMVLPSLATNITQCIGPQWRTLIRRLSPMWLSLASATLFSPLADIGTAGGHTRVALGAVLVMYALWGLAKPSLPDVGRHTVFVGVLAGALSGVLTAATGVFVIPMVPYLQSLKLGREGLIQALGLSFTVATLALAARLGQAGITESAPDIAGGAVAMMSAFIGVGVGARLLHRFPPATFQRVLYAVLLLLGLIMIGRSL